MTAPTGSISSSMSAATVDEELVSLASSDVVIGDGRMSTTSPGTSSFYSNLVKNFAHHLQKQFHQVAGANARVQITAENMSIAAAQLVDIIERQRGGRFIITVNNKYRVLTRSAAVNKVANDLLKVCNAGSTGLNTWLGGATPSRQSQASATVVVGGATMYPTTAPASIRGTVQASTMYHTNPRHHRDPRHPYQQIHTPVHPPSRTIAPARVPGSSAHAFQQLYGTAAPLATNTAAMGTLIPPNSAASSSTSTYRNHNQDHHQNVMASMQYYLQEQQQQQQQQGTTTVGGGSPVLTEMYRIYLNQQQQKQHQQEHDANTGVTGESSSMSQLQQHKRTPGLGSISRQQQVRLQAASSTLKFLKQPQSKERRDHLTQKSLNKVQHTKKKSSSEKRKDREEEDARKERKKKKPKTSVLQEKEGSRKILLAASIPIRTKKEHHSKRSKQKHCSHLVRMILAVLRALASGKSPIASAKVLDHPVLLNISKKRPQQQQKPPPHVQLQREQENDSEGNVNTADNKKQEQQQQQQQQESLPDDNLPEEKEIGIVRQLKSQPKLLANDSKDKGNTGDSKVQQSEELPQHQQQPSLPGGDIQVENNIAIVKRLRPLPQPLPVILKAEDNNTGNNGEVVEIQRLETGTERVKLATDNDVVLEVKETEKQRRMRLLLRHRYLSAASNKVSLFTFSKDLLKMWGCHRYVDIATSIMSRKKQKNAIVISTKAKKGNEVGDDQAIGGKPMSSDIDTTTADALIDTKTPKRPPGCGDANASSSGTVVVEGSWNLEERLVFLQEWEQNGIGDWGKMAEAVPTRSRIQIASFGRYIIRKHALTRGDKPTDELRAFFRRPSDASCPVLTPEHKEALKKALVASTVGRTGDKVKDDNEVPYGEISSPLQQQPQQAETELKQTAPAVMEANPAMAIVESDTLQKTGFGMNSTEILPEKAVAYTPRDIAGKIKTESIMDSDSPVLPMRPLADTSRDDNSPEKSAVYISPDSVAVSFPVSCKDFPSE